MTTEQQTPNRTTIVGMAFVAGIGVTLMILAAIFGVIGGSEADAAASNQVGVLFIVGVGLTLAGLIAWFFTVRPFANFDDINVPLYHGHDHDDEH